MDCGLRRNDPGITVTPASEPGPITPHRQSLYGKPVACRALIVVS